MWNNQTIGMTRKEISIVEQILTTVAKNLYLDLEDKIYKECPEDWKISLSVPDCVELNTALSKLRKELAKETE